MKIYRCDIENGTEVYFEGEVPDGALCLDLGSRMDPGDPSASLPPIVHINFRTGRFQREGGDSQPIPELVYQHDDVAWRRMSEDEVVEARS